MAAARAGLDWANAEGLRTIVVRGGASGPSAVAARGNVDVLTWARSISAGEMIQPADLVWGKAAMAPTDAPNDPDAMVGMAARRALRAGAVVAGRDVSAPQVVKTNEVVTLTYDNGGVSLSMQAKALSAGAVGETINVQNVTSKKTVQAVVTGPGQAAVGPHGGAAEAHPLDPLRAPLKEAHMRLRILSPSLALAPLAACSTVTEAVKWP